MLNVNDVWLIKNMKVVFEFRHDNITEVGELSRTELTKSPS
jgi:hypothetical protein